MSIFPYIFTFQFCIFPSALPFPALILLPIYTFFCHIWVCFSRFGHFLRFFGPEEGVMGLPLHVIWDHCHSREVFDKQALSES